MDLQFLNARNGQQTCSADGRYLHSSFNPQIESERFIQSLTSVFTPSAVILAGACLPWCIAPLRKKFPDARLVAVQYDARFENESSEWDNVFFITDDADSHSFSTSLFNLLGEEKLMTTLFLSWKPSEAVWIDETRLFWSAVKACMEKAQSVLTTRNWFNLRWFKNTIHNLASISNYVLPEKTNLPVVVTASGPSLEKALPFLSANRKSFCLLAASSSISTLLSHDIVPDLCISTDGGWYATRHLRCYQTDIRLKNVPLIISAESAVPAPLYNSVPFILLSYGDAVETLLAEELDIPCVKGLRNGTVSGTAAAFALSLTTSDVYICGLDLAPGKGFQHAEPNENDVPLFTGQSRIRTLETAQSSSRYASGSLSLYREWFSSQGPDFSSRIIRLISEAEPLEPLGTIKDICCEKLSLPEHSTSEKPLFKSARTEEMDKADSRVRIQKYFSSVSELLKAHPDDNGNSIWFSTLAIKSYINWLRMSDSDKKDFLPSLVTETTDCIKEVLAHV